MRTHKKRVQWDIETVEKKYCEIPQKEFEQRLEEVLHLLVNKESAFSIASNSTDGLASQLEEEIA